VDALILTAVACMLAVAGLRLVLPMLARHRRAQPTSVTILDRVRLDSRSGLCVVCVLDRLFLLGTGDGHVVLLAALDERGQAAAPCLAPAPVSRDLQIPGHGGG
jgi:hypothetical protein